MNPRSPSFEANLLYRDARRMDPAALVQDFRAAAQDHGVQVVAVEQIEDGFVLITCDVVQVLVGTCPDPLPVQHFLDAARPRAAQFGDTVILDRLTRHQSSVTILVMDLAGEGMRFGPVHERLKRTLCWELTDCLLTESTPELVFWCDTDTMYAAEEFERASAYLAAQDDQIWGGVDVPGERSSVPTHFREQPIVTDQALAWINGSAWDAADVDQYPAVEARDMPHEGPADARALDSLLSLTLPDRAAIRFDRFQMNMDLHRAVNGLAMTCATTTIGLTGLPFISMLGL